MSNKEFPIPHDGLELADDEHLPGEPLHPGEHTIVDRENEPLTRGETIQVWFEAYADGFGVETVKFQVIGDDGKGDIFAIPAYQDPLNASRVYRLAGDLETIRGGYVYAVPEYDHEEGVLTVTREVKTNGSDTKELLEARSLGGRQDWALVPSNEL